MYQYFFTFLIVLFIFCQSPDVKEGVINTNCCGGIRLNRNDFSEGDENPPDIISKCFRDPDEWESMPCTNANSNICCGGEGRCIPTRQGGMCEKTLGNNRKEYFQYNYGRKHRMSGRDLRNVDEIDLNRRSRRNRVLERRRDSLYRPVQFDDSLSSSTATIVIVGIITLSFSIVAAFMYYYRDK